MGTFLRVYALPMSLRWELRLDWNLIVLLEGELCKVEIEIENGNVLVVC